MDCANRATETEIAPQATEIAENPACNIMGNSVSRDRAVPGRHVCSSDWSLFAASGRRKYLTRAELLRVLAAFDALPSERRLFALTLAWTGARVSEILALTPSAFDLDSGLVAIRTLKRRRFAMREVPLPRMLVQELAASFDLAVRQQDAARAEARLWRFGRTTAWRMVTCAMAQASISGRPATPRGLRHGFGVGALQAGVPVTLVQRWLGHARLSTTAIYADVSGPEERAMVERYWRWSSENMRGVQG